MRSRQPLLHYYSYPACRGYGAGRRVTTAGSAESSRPAPFAEGSSGGPQRARDVCTLEVLPSMSRRTTWRGGGPPSLSYFFLRAHVNQSGTICRPSSARTYERNNEDVVKKCLSAATDFSCESVSATAATGCLEAKARRAGAIFSSITPLIYRRK